MRKDNEIMTASTTNLEGQKSITSVISPQPKNNASSAIVFNKELDRNLDEVCELRNHYNFLKHQTSQLYKVVEDLQTKCQEMNISQEEYEAPLEEKSADEHEEEMQRETLIQLEETLFHSNRKTNMLKFMLDRTKIKKRDLTKVLEAYKKKYNSIKIEEIRINEMARDCENEKNNAKNELRQANSNLHKQKELHANEITEMQTMLAERKRLSEERDAVNIRRSQIVLQAQGDLDEEGEEKLKSELVAAKLKKVRLHAKEHEIDNKISFFEESYQRIKQSTGINDINEILEKLNNQKETGENIKAMTMEAEKKIANLNAELISSTKLLSEIQLSGLGNIGKQRPEIVEFEQELENLSIAVKTSNQKVSYVSSILEKSLHAIKYIGSKIRDMTDDHSFNVDDIREENIIQTISHFEAKITAINSSLLPEYRNLSLSKIPIRQLIYVDPSSTPSLSEDAIFDMNIGDDKDEDGSRTARSKIKREVNDLMKEIFLKRKKIIKKQEKNEVTRGNTMSTEELKQLEQEVILSIKKKLKVKEKESEDDEMDALPLISTTSLSSTPDYSAKPRRPSQSRKSSIVVKKVGNHKRKIV